MENILDERTERNIATLLPSAQPIARRFMIALEKAGISAKIISGTRTYAEQDLLFKQATDGKDNDGDGKIDERDEMVTRARPGHSNHNFGIAWDIGIFIDGKYQPEHIDYKRAGKVGTDMGLEWGGSWTTIVDEPHFEIKTGMTITQKREAFEEGELNDIVRSKANI